MTNSGLAAVHAAAMGSTSLAAVAAATAPVARADHEAAIAKARDDGKQEGLAEGRKAGAAGERERVKAILGSEHAKGREALAQHLAFDTEMPAEAAVAALGVAPKVESKSRLDGLVPQPKVDATETKPPSAAAAWDGIVDDLNKSAARSARR